jgi:hypothetical protein
LFDLRGECVTDARECSELIFAHESIEIGDSLNRARAGVVCLRFESILAAFEIHQLRDLLERSGDSEAVELRFLFLGHQEQVCHKKAQKAQKEN